MIVLYEKLWDHQKFYSMSWGVYECPNQIEWQPTPKFNLVKT